MSVFKFKYFSIIQEASAMKVGTDALLLGALTKLNNERSILDIGSGTGVVSLMCAQRTNAEIICGIEIDEVSFNECRLNYQNSQWSNRMQSIHGDFNSYDFKGSFDLIISNPPYYSDGFKGDDERVNAAKHVDNLTPEKFFAKALELLSEKGRVVIIVPSESFHLWVNSATDSGLKVNHQIVVFGKEGGGEKRRILTFSKNDLDVLSEEFTIRDANGAYTDAYRNATTDFHGVELK